MFFCSNEMNKVLTYVMLSKCAYESKFLLFSVITRLIFLYPIFIILQLFSSLYLNI